MRKSLLCISYFLLTDPRIARTIVLRFLSLIGENFEMALSSLESSFAQWYLTSLSCVSASGESYSPISSSATTPSNAVKFHSTFFTRVSLYSEGDWKPENCPSSIGFPTRRIPLAETRTTIIHDVYNKTT